MRRTLFRWAFSVAILGALCTGASHRGLAAPKNAPARAAGEPNEARATSESSLSDGQILGVANAANDGEIALSNLASSKAQSEPVRQLALLVLKDHGAAKEQGRKLAAKLRIKPAPSAIGNALQKQTDDVLGHLEKSGSLDFDRVYVESQVRVLQRVLSVFDEVLPQVDAKELAALVTDMRGKAEHHLEVARSTLGNH